MALTLRIYNGDNEISINGNHSVQLIYKDDEAGIDKHFVFRQKELLKLVDDYTTRMEKNTKWASHQETGSVL